MKKKPIQNSIGGSGVKALRSALFACLLLFLVNSSLHAQTCCLTDTLNISTGWDPSTSAVIAGGTEGGAVVADPHWKVCNVSTNMLAAITPFTPALTSVTIGGSADVVLGDVGAGDWVSGGSQWINFFNGITCNPASHQPAYAIFTRTFRLCQPACVKFNLKVAADDWVNDIHVDAAGCVPLSRKQNS